MLLPYFHFISAVGLGDKTQITVLACCNAAGYALPPFVIFDRMSLKPEPTVGEVPGTVYGLSKKGWIDGDLFELWFARHFLSHAPPVRPLLLLVDGHSSHFEPSVIQRAASEGVILFCLPPHTIHLTQPLDQGCFGPISLKVFGLLVFTLLTDMLWFPESPRKPHWPKGQA